MLLVAGIESLVMHTSMNDKHYFQLACLHIMSLTVLCGLLSTHEVNKSVTCVNADDHTLPLKNLPYESKM